MMAKKIILSYPNFYQDVDVYTDATDYQLGMVIVQKDWVVACYSRKLTSTQRNYTGMEKELFSTIETCVYFRNSLLKLIFFFQSQEPDLRHF